MADKIKIKTPCCGKLYWVKGINEEDGYENDLSGKFERSATIRYSKDSEQAKALMEQLQNFWEEYRAENKIKQKEPKTWGWKPVLDQDGNETGEIEFKFKTNAKFPDGKINWVRIYNAKGEDVTNLMRENDIKIGNESIGIIHGEAGIYEYAKQFGISLYLKGIQVAKLVKYDPNDVEPEDLSDVGDFETPDNVDGMPSLDEGEAPNI